MKQHNQDWEEKGDYTEFFMVSDIYSNSGKKEKIIKKNVASKISLYITDIQGHEQIVNSRGNLVKNYCRIFHRGLGPLVVKSTYENISKLKVQQHEPLKNKIGF